MQINSPTVGFILALLVFVLCVVLAFTGHLSILIALLLGMLAVARML